MDTNNHYYNEPPQQAPQEEEQKEIDIVRLGKDYLRYWKVYLSGIALCLLLATLYAVMSVRKYPVEASILFLHEKENKSRIMSGNFDFTEITTGIKNVSIDNELQLIKSREILRQTIEESGMYLSVRGKKGLRTEVYYDELPFKLEIDPLALREIHTDKELKIDVLGKDSYEISGKGKDEENFSVKVTSLPATFQTPYGIMTLMPRDKIKTEPNSSYKVIIHSPEALAISYAKGGLSVSKADKGSSVAILQIKSLHRKKGEDFLNKLVEVYNRQRSIDKDEVARKTYDFITERIAKIGSELTDTEKRLESIKKNEGVTGFEDLGAIVRGRMDIERMKVDAQTQLSLINSLSNFIHNSNNRFELIPNTMLPTGLKDATLASAIELYNQLLFKRNTLSESSGDKHPSIIALEKEISMARQNVAEATAMAKKGVEIALNAARSQERKYAGQIASAPTFERITNDIMRQKEIRASLYLMLLKKREETSIEIASNANSAKIVDQALAARIPSEPKLPIILFSGLLLGMFLPTAGIFLWRITRTKIRTEEDVKALTSLPILSTVPVDHSLSSGEIVVSTDSNNVMTEVFRSLRTNVSFITKGKVPVTIFVTSTTPAEGKTFIAANLASSFAALGRETILVGMDVRNPQLKRVFGLDSFGKKGLTDLINDETIPIWDHIISNRLQNHLSMLHSGTIPPNPTELLSLERLDQIFQELRQRYEYIIVDSAPVGPVVDTIVASRVADATVYVTRAKKTEKSDFDYINYLHAKGQLPHMSIVINGIETHHTSYGKSYGYGYGYDQSGKKNDQTNEQKKTKRKS